MNITPVLVIAILMLWLNFVAMQQISMYMIIYRLAEGRGWDHESMESSATFTTMQLNDERVRKIELPGTHEFAYKIPPTFLPLMLYIS